MDAPHGMEVSTSPPLPERLLRAVAALELSSRLAIVCVFFGWFFMNTFVVSLGSLAHGVRFFDLSAVIADPTRLFFDADTPVHRTLFGAVCIACLLAPLAPHLHRVRAAWVGFLLPLALILLCGALLYWRTSGELFASPSDARSLGGDFLHMANDLVRHGSDLVARHVVLGAGSYLALIGAVVLAFQGARGLRR